MNAITHTFSLLFFLLWLIHLETDPGLGKIWIRPDSEGQLQLSFHNIIKFFILPFQQSWVWKPQFMDLNPYTMFLVCYMLFQLVKWNSNVLLEKWYQSI